MRYLAWVLGILLALALGMIGLERTASERVEVVELHTFDESGERITTRLWVVDDGGYQYLRVGSDGSEWYSRLQANEAIELTRGDTSTSFIAVARPELSQRINQLMREKYTWGDAVIGLLTGGRQGSVPIELHEL